MKAKSIIICILIILTARPSGLCYQGETHKLLNSTAVNNAFSGPLKEYLQNNLGYADIKQHVNGFIIEEWFVNAGKQEDDFPRFVNHFLDPISNEGYNGLWGSQLAAGNPAPVWAQKAEGQQYPGGAHSWKDARDAFHHALTATNQYVRESYLANTFRSVGQVMHLVQDMTVPEHTRDTTHIWNYTIESFIEKIASHYKHPYRAQFDTVLAYTPVSPDPALLQLTGLIQGAPLPITNLFDAGMYDGTNPAITLGNSIGLAEYSNANFFSFNTIFKDYPNPAKANVTEFAETDPVTGKIKTFVRSAEVNHLAQTTVFYRYLVFGKTKGYTLENDKIYLDYMEKLLPRAVGYSAALLDYFFRGNIDLQIVSDSTTFRTITITAKNDTANGDEMLAGQVSLVIRYKEYLESGTGANRKLNFPADEYKYRVITLPDPVIIPRENPVQLTFDLSADPLPLHIADVTLQLVYKGVLGNENGAVVVGSKPLEALGTDIALSLPSTGVYAKTTDGPFNELSVTAKTDIPDGLSLSDGVIELVLEYQVATSDPYASLPVEVDPQDAQSYIIRIAEKNGVKTLPQGVPVELQFDLSTAPLPLWATDVYANVVYRRNGEPEEKSLAVGYHDISEPTPVDIFNNTDYVCLAGQWYEAGDPAAIARADQLGNNNGIDDDVDTYRHDFIDIYENNSSIDNPVIASASTFNFLDPGPLTPPGLKRMGYILTDYAFKYSYLPQWVHTDTHDDWTRTEVATMFNGTAVMNQTDNEGVYHYPSMYNMRGKPMWSGAGVVYDNVRIPPACAWESLPSAP